MRVNVPNAIVDNEYPAFAPGTYDGTIASADVRDPNKDGSWLLIKLGLSDVTPREGTQGDGRSAFSGDIVIRNTDQETGAVQDLREMESINGECHWSIERGAGLLAGIGFALGVADRDEQNTTVDLAQVAEALVDGDFAGQRVGFEVGNYISKKNQKTYDQFNAIGPAS